MRHVGDVGTILNSTAMGVDVPTQYVLYSELLDLGVVATYTNVSR